MPAKVLINLATGLEDAERVMVAFLVANADRRADYATAKLLQGVSRV